MGLVTCDWYIFPQPPGADGYTKDRFACDLEPHWLTLLTQRRLTQRFAGTEDY